MKNNTIMNTKLKIKLTGILLLMVLANIGMAQQPAIQYFRSYDQRGINVFETPKNDTVPFEGLKVRFGANFAQGYQSISQKNSAKAVLTSSSYANVVGKETSEGSGNFDFINVNTGAPVTVDGISKDPNVYGGYIDASNKLWINSNQLYQLSGGFPLAMANLNIDVQLADGVRVSLVSYMSSHHHNEFWVKGGYFQIDKVGFVGSEFLNKIWKNLTLKVGHMEINYGDAHFRRSDGGNTLWNPFIENNIMDAYSTEIGGELYWQKYGVIAMMGITDGEIQGSVTKPGDRKPSVYGKLGYDRVLGDRTRIRLTGSFYTTKSSISNTLYGGDRTGSNYQYVMENTAATLTANAFSGRVNPGFKDNVTSIMINPFVKFKGLEVFGTYEIAKGNAAVENGEVQYSDQTKPRIGKLSDREFDQVAIDLLYRFGKNEKFFVGGKYNKVNGTLSFGQSTSQAGINQGTRDDVSIDRTALGAGWFITRNVLLKGEYVTQNFNGYPTDNIASKGQFNGFVVQGVIGF